jgi:predicted phage baseplate assembly protein
MPLQAPDLDTRTFAELKAELRRRIPRYTPEWTDFNESDPGIILVDLFAWLTESLLFQMNRLPERNYIKFLQLLNLELQPPLPATAHLTFTPTADATLQPIPSRTRVAAQPPAGGEPVVFETEVGLDLIPLLLTDVQVYDGSAFTVVTENNTPWTSSYRPFGWSPQPGSALYLGFTPPKNLPPKGQRLLPQQLRFRLFLPPAAAVGEPQNCSTSQQPPAPPVKLAWEYRHPNTPTYWQPLSLYQDETAAFTREGYILVAGPAEIAQSGEGKLPESRYWLRCRLVEGTYPVNQIPEIALIRPNTVPAQQLVTVQNELLGNSEGHPDQLFTLRYKPMFRDSLSLTTQLSGEAEEEWQRVDDWLSSGPEDRHYVLSPVTGEIRFGDGQRGRIPVAGAEIIAREYRYGGGLAGNVGAGLISTLLASVQGVEKVTNEQAAAGGRDEQSLEDLKAKAPAVLRHRNRAMSAEDFTALAREVGGVAKATTLPLAHPDFPYPEVQVPGTVTVVIVPAIPESPPVPSPELLRQAANYLDAVRLITTEVYVRGPRYLAIKVETRVVAKPYAAFGKVETDVKTALNQRLDPLSWPFGRELYPTGLYDVIYHVEGVVAVTHLRLFVNGLPHERLEEPVVVPPDGLVYGTTDHDITVVPEADL